MNSKNLFKPQQPKSEGKKLSANAKALIASGVILTAAAAAVFATAASKRAAARRAQAVGTEYIVEDAETVKMQQESARREERRGRLLANLGSALLGLVSFLATAGIQLLGAAAAGLTAAAGGVIGVLVQFLVAFSVMMLLFGIAFKRLYPERKLKELYTLKNIGLMLGGSLVITVVNVLSAAYLPISAIHMAFLQSLASIAVYAGAWYLVFRQKGYFGSRIDAAIRGPRGAGALVGFVGTAVGASFLKVYLASLGSVSVLAPAVAAFVLCLAVSTGGFLIIRSVQKRLDIRNARGSKLIERRG